MFILSLRGAVIVRSLATSPAACHGPGPSQPGNMEIYLFLISWLIYFWELGTCRVLHNLGSRPTDEGYNEVLRLLEMYYCVGKYGKISNMKHCTKQSCKGEHNVQWRTGTLFCYSDFRGWWMSSQQFICIITVNFLHQLTVATVSSECKKFPLCWQLADIKEQLTWSWWLVAGR